MKSSFVNNCLKVITNVFNFMFYKQTNKDLIYKPLTNTYNNPPKHHTKRRGGFGNCHNQDASGYITLRVLPKHKQTKENCNYCGVQNDL